jgi:hypothetical protein
MYSPIGKDNPGSNRWHVFSKKLKREVRLNGLLEYEHWILIETDPNISDFCEKPKEIVYSIDSKLVKTTFDMWVKWKDGKEEFIAVDFSYSLDIKHNRFSKKAITEINAQKLWCQDNNLNHRVQTEEDIRKNSILLQNKMLLLPYSQEYVKLKPEEVSRVVELIKNGYSKLHQIQDSLKILQLVQVKKIVYSLILEGILKSNIDSVLLGPNTEVFINE